jgi:hypothetical protein
MGKQLFAGPEGQRRYEEATAPASGDDDKDGVVSCHLSTKECADGEAPTTTNIQEANELRDLLMACWEGGGGGVSASTSAAIT